jgi:predicted O-methyltransferase YrrM
MNLSIDPKTVKGFLDPKEGEALYNNALLYSLKGPCLEIGSYCGKSALYIGSATKINNQILYSIDHHKGSEEQQPGEEYCDPDLIDETGKGINTLPFFLETLKRADLESSVSAIISSSLDAGENWKKPLGMVFIDGSHTLEAAMQDYYLWHEHILPGGLLAIHDVFPDPKDGGRPPHEIYLKALESRLFQEVGMVKSLALLEKIS